MKKINIKIRIVQIVMLLVGLSFTWGCKDDQLIGIIEEGGNTPGAVSNVTVINGHGKATLKYRLPDDPNLLYVKAEYKLPSGEIRVIKASHYTNEMVVDGFDSTLPYVIQLFAVNRSEVSSAPTEVTISPNEPIFNLVFAEMEVTPTFGGIRIQAKNEFNGDVVIVPMVDSLGNGEYLPLESYYTEDAIINYNVRGLRSKEMKFAFYVRDRWLNSSDTLYSSMVPLEENLLDRNRFESLRLPGDAEFMHGTTLDMLWDGSNDPGRWPSLYTVESAGEPQTLTFSIGRSAKISRVVIYPRREDGFYDKGNLRDFEVWGSDQPALDGSWESWDRIAVCNVVKPSGAPPGTNSGADDAAGQMGWSFDMAEDAPKYKYLRIRNLRNWRGSYFMQINQVHVWGVY